MVIYHCITYYHMLKCSVHKLRFHENEQAILLVPDTLQRRCSGLTSLDKSIFSAVYLYQWNANPPGGSKQAKIQEISNQLSEWLGENYLSEIKEINICSAAYYFGIWAVEMELSFNWFEEADGMLSKAHFLREADSVNKIRYAMAEECGNYTGDNPYVIKKYIRIDSQPEGFFDPLAVNFDVIEEMRMLSDDKKKMLLSFFDVPTGIKFERNSALMLTQHFTNLGMLSYEEQALIYQLTLDYYMFDCKVYMKWHPTDITNYPDFLENIEMISGNFPTELLTLVITEPLKICGSVESSGTLSLAPICNKILLFDREYVVKTFRQNHRYYFCLKLMECLPDYDFSALGINKLHMTNMLEFNNAENLNNIKYISSFDEIIQNSCSVYFISKCELMTNNGLSKLLQKCSVDDVFVFLNAEDENYFYDLKEVIPYLVKEIKIRALDTSLYGTMVGCERIFVFSKNKETLEKIKKMKYIKELLQTGVETAVLDMTDKEMEIAALKGMLKATEIQLKQSIKENRELKQLLKQQKR